LITVYYLKLYYHFKILCHVYKANKFVSEVNTIMLANRYELHKQS